MRLVINVANDRLKVEGFRVGMGVDTDSVDQLAWKVWRANHLAKGSRAAHRDAMKFGKSFVLVDPFDANGNVLASGATPRITIESPYQVIGVHRRMIERLWSRAIKKWVGDDGYLYLNFYPAGCGAEVPVDEPAGVGVAGYGVAAVGSSVVGAYWGA